MEPSEHIGGQERYIVAVDWHHFLVDRSTACLIEALRTQTSYDRLAEHLHQELGEALDIDDVRNVVENRLPPELFCPSEGKQKTPFTWQRQLVSRSALEPLTRITSGLVRKPLLFAFLVLLIIVDAAVLLKWVQNPTALWSGGVLQWPVVMGLVLLGVLIHELGHVSALRRFGRQSGGIGFGIYWIFPTFYADVSETWRLPGRHRALVDVGGLYFQGIYMIGIGVWALLAEHPETPILVMWTSHFMMLYTLNPTLKFDGYWLLTDLTGVTNLHSRIMTSARQLVSRLRGDRDTPPLTTHHGRTLAAFSLGALLYFGYLFVSLSSGLFHATKNLIEGDRDSWVSTAGTALVAALLGIILLILVQRCIKILLILFTTEAPALHAEKETGT